MVNHRLKRSSIRHPALDAFRNELREAVLAGALALHHAFSAHLGAGKVFGALKVALARTLAHGSKRAHAAIALEAAPLIENGFAGALINAGKQGADHDGTSSGGDGLGDLARVLDAAVGDDGNAALLCSTRCFGNGRDLRHSRAGDHARGANGAGSDANFNSVSARVDQGHGALVGGYVASQYTDMGKPLLHFADRLKHA